MTTDAFFGGAPFFLPLRLSTPANTLSCVVERSLFPSGGSLLTVRGLDFAFTRDCLLLNSELNLTRTKSVSRGICRQVSTPSCGGHCGTQAWLGVGISTGAPTDYQYRRYRALICCFQRSPTLTEFTQRRHALHHTPARVSGSHRCMLLADRLRCFTGFPLHRYACCLNLIRA